MQTSVIIPHHTTSADTITLRSVIDSVLSQTVGRNVEVVVVCNPPSPQEKELQKLYGEQVKVLSSPGAHVNKARNLGIKHASGETILFLDDDCILEDSKAIETIAGKFQSDSGLSACGGNIKLAPGAGQWDRAYAAIQQKWIQRARQPDETNAYLFGGFLAARASELKDVQFEEGISFGGAEIGMVGQLRRRGRKILWLEDLHVLHKSRLTFFGFIYRAFKQGQNMGNALRPPVAKICYAADALARPTSSELLYSYIYSLGKQWGGPLWWNPFAYARFSWDFCREWFRGTPLGRRWLELRTLSRVLKVLR